MPDHYRPPLPYEVGFHLDVPEESYHADPNSLSVSGAKTLLRSPAAYRWQQDHPEHKDVFDTGTAFHTKTLGVGPPIAVFDGASFHSKAGRAFQAEAREAGHTPITAEDDEHTTGMARSVLEHPPAVRWLTGDKEVSAWGKDPVTGVLRRARFDCLGPDFIGDLKSTRDASPEAFTRDVVNFRYQMQAAWYLDLAESLGHPALGFAFVAVEKKPPYFPAVYELDEEALDLGRALNRHALDKYAVCRETGSWPGYSGDQPWRTLSLPAYAFKEPVG